MAVSAKTVNARKQLRTPMQTAFRQKKKVYACACVRERERALSVIRVLSVCALSIHEIKLLRQQRCFFLASIAASVHSLDTGQCSPQLSIEWLVGVLYSQAYT